MKKYGAKKDHNHNSIVAHLERMGCKVVDLSGAGFSVPDTIVWVGGKWVFAEIKNLNTKYGIKGLNDNQKKFAEKFKESPVYILSTLNEATLFAEQKFNELNYYPK